MNKYRGLFLNFIYIVLLVEIALNINNINVKKYYEILKKTEQQNIFLKNLLGNKKKENENYFSKIDKKNEDFENTQQIISLINEEELFFLETEKLKKLLINQNGGYDKKGEIKKIKKKNTIKNKENLKQIENIFSSFYRITKTSPGEEEKKTKTEKKESKKKEGTKIEEIKNLKRTKKFFQKKTKPSKNSEKNEEEKFLTKREKEFVDENKIKKKTLIEIILDLSEKQHQVLIYTLAGIEKLEGKMFKNKSCYNFFDLIVKPQKKTIRKGQPFEAEVYLAAKNNSSIPEIKINNTPIKFENGVGKITIPSPQNAIFNKEGISQQFFEIEYKQKSPHNNKDIVFKKKEEYFISDEKIVEGQFATIESLYKNCLNPYRLKILDPEKEKGLSFNFSGGKYYIIERKNNEILFNLFPTEKFCILHVLNKQKEEVDKINFETKEIKKPKIDIVINGKTFPENTGFYPDEIRNVFINISVDEELKNKFPKETFYKVGRFYIIFCKKNRPFYTKEITNENYYNLSYEKEMLLQADKIIIKTNLIKRVYKDENKEEIREENIFKENEFFSRFFTILKKKENEEN